MKSPFHRRRPPNIWLRIEEAAPRRRGRQAQRIVLQEKHLTAGKTTKMNPISLTGATPIFLGFIELDQTGNPMVTPVPPDTDVSPNPGWTNSTPATGSIVPSSTNLSATYTPIANGTDVVTCTLQAGGAVFTATVAITVTGIVVVPPPPPPPPQQVLSSIALQQLTQLDTLPPATAPAAPAAGNSASS